MPKKTAKKSPAKAKASGYSSEQITVLEGLEPVKKRPGMYIGSTGARGLHHLIWEVVDNGIDEAMAGYATEIEVTLNKNGSVTVRDNGRGIPVDIHKQQKVSALELVMTKLHAGGKFGAGGYKVSGGLHGVGVSVVNALSVWMVAEVHKDGNWYVQEYEAGIPKYKVKKLGKISAIKDVALKIKDAAVPRDEAWSQQATGTRQTFMPNADIFETTEFSWDTIIDHLRRQAYLNKGIRIRLRNLAEEQEKRYQFYFEGGIATYVKYINRNKEKKQDDVFYVEKEVSPDADDKNKNHLPVVVETAVQYTDDVNESIFCFANNIINPEGGMHLVGFRTALTRTLNNYARNKGFLKEKDQNLSGEDVREGLTAVISVKIPEPQFEGQTKAKLGNPEVRPAVDQVVSQAFADFLETRPREAEKIIGKILLAQQARLAAKSAREAVIRKGALEGMTLPGKLADCSSRDADKCEIYIVEGDSAGGSAKQGRNREFQAILPLRGKVLNVERYRLDKVLANNELKSLIIALGTNIGEQFDIEGLRYNRIIIMTDADVDGSHIRTLLLTFFYRYFPELVKQGHLYVAQPPLYAIRKGKNTQFAYTEEEKETILKEFTNAKEDKKPAKGAKAKASDDTSGPEEETDENADQTGVGENIAGVVIQRYKGLGEMNADQLWETTMDPEHRVMNQVTIEDAEQADSTFSILMGSEVMPRKKFIQTHAASVENLDI